MTTEPSELNDQQASPRREAEGLVPPVSLWPDDLTLCDICHIDLAREGMGTHGWDMGNRRILCPAICRFPRATVPAEGEGQIDRLMEELCKRIEDGRELIDEGDYSYERAFVMAERQVKRIRSATQSTATREKE